MPQTHRKACILMTESRTTGEYLQDLASASSAPGGGSAAALAAALGASLCSMAANLTLGKKKYIAVEADMHRIISRCASLQAEFLRLSDADAEAFLPLSRIYALPKDAPGYAELFAQASIQACSAVCGILDCCCETVQLLEETLEKCSRLLISDVACGAALCRAAMECAALNIYINTRSVRSSPEAARIEEKTETILKEYLPRAERMLSSVTEALRGNTNA